MYWFSNKIFHALSAHNRFCKFFTAFVSLQIVTFINTTLMYYQDQSLNITSYLDLK